ncbi:hypothetical protein [Streptomyces sp. NPDC090025]|uniref:hypothetical protein n=1 Tax=Streptomyces sp. NPDC090025 TaxID=3365922 RepID=UPI00383926E3
MNRPAPLRSPIALLTGLALLCGTLAVFLSLAAPAQALTRQGSFTLQATSGKITDTPFAASVTTDAGCPAPADPAKPYVQARMFVMDTEFRDTKSRLADIPAGQPLSGGPFTRSLTGERSLQAAIKELVGDAPADGRYELRLACRTATSADDDFFFSRMIEVSGDNWTSIGQRATLLQVTSDPVVPWAGSSAKLVASVAPADAAGTVAFQKFVNDELIDIATVPVADGKAETTLGALTAAPDGIAIVATYTPTDAEAYTSALRIYTLYVTAESPSPSPTTPSATPTSPSGTPTATGTPTETPTDDPSETPTDDPSGTPTDTATPTPDPSDTGAATDGQSGSNGSTGTGGSSGGGSGGNGNLASTGAQAGAAAFGALALVLLGAALVIHVRRRGSATS